MRTPAAVGPPAALCVGTRDNSSDATSRVMRPSQPPRGPRMPAQETDIYVTVDVIDVALRTNNSENDVAAVRHFACSAVCWAIVTATEKYFPHSFSRSSGHEPLRLHLLRSIPVQPQADDRRMVQRAWMSPRNDGSPRGIQIFHLRIGGHDPRGGPLIAIMAPHGCLIAALVGHASDRCLA